MHDVSLATGFLQGFPPFDALTPGELEALARGLSAAYYARDTFIFASRPPPGLAIIRKGAVRLVDEDQSFLDKRSEGGLFGHQIHFHGSESEYRAEAAEDSLIWHLSQEDFERVMAGNATFAAYFENLPQFRVRAALDPPGRATQILELIHRDPVTLQAARSIREAARLMSEERVSSVLIMRGNELKGIVTDKDLRDRVLAAGLDPSETVERVMTRDPETLACSGDMHQALLAMIRGNFRHLPVIDDHDRVTGLVTAGDLLRAQSEHPLRMVSDIHKQGSLDALIRLSDRLPSLFMRLIRMGRNVEQTGRLVTHITDAFTTRLIQLGQQQLGPAPMPFAWIALGSQAREEQVPGSDQDNGLILAREPDHHESEYFSQLADFVCGGLDQLGYHYCPGEVMAMNARWRVSLRDWMRHFDGWIEEGDPKSVMFCGIFFDMRCVHGDAQLVDTLLDHAVGRARDHQIFRRFMATNIARHRPPIGFFRQFVQEDDGSHSEGLNLKHRAMVPITKLARIRALESGITAPNTFTRLRLAAELGGIAEADADSLRDALTLINRVRLSHQAEQLAAGDPPGHFVPIESLSPLMRRNLKAAFLLVVHAQSALSLRYQVR